MTCHLQLTEPVYLKEDVPKSHLTELSPRRNIQEERPGFHDECSVLMSFYLYGTFQSALRHRNAFKKHI